MFISTLKKKKKGYLDLSPFLSFRGLGPELSHFQMKHPQSKTKHSSFEGGLLGVYPKIDVQVGYVGRVSL